MGLPNPTVSDNAAFDLDAGLAEGGEGLVLGVVHQDIAVGKKQDARLAMAVLPVPAGVPKLPADLEGDQGLAGSGGHAQKNAVTTLKYGLHDAVDRDLLVVAQRFALVLAGGCQEMLGR